MDITELIKSLSMRLMRWNLFSCRTETLVDYVQIEDGEARIGLLNSGFLSFARSQATLASRPSASGMPRFHAPSVKVDEDGSVWLDLYRTKYAVANLISVEPLSLVLSPFGLENMQESLPVAPFEFSQTFRDAACTDSSAWRRKNDLIAQLVAKHEKGFFCKLSISFSENGNYRIDKRAVDVPESLGPIYMVNGKVVRKQMNPDLPDECAICRMDFEKESDRHMLGCHHCYHKGCIDEWCKVRNICPMCESPVVGSIHHI